MAIEINRRDFLKVSAAAAASTMVCSPMASAMELELGGKDFHQLRTFHPRRRKPYLCASCPYFDGGFTFAEKGRIQKAEGNPDHIATRGKFCAKGLACFFAATDPDRITAPLKRVGRRGAGKWQEISWEEAIAEVAGKVAEALDNAGADSIYLNEGGFKDGATLRFMNTLGSRSILRSRVPSISNAAKRAALKSMLGVDFMLPDLEHAAYVLNFGANILETAPPLAQRLTDGVVGRRLKLVTFDVRMSNTAGRSDEWIPVFPGSDGIVALAMANVIMQQGLADTDFIDGWTNVSSEALAEHLKQFSLDRAQKASGVSAETIERIAVEFAKTKPATVFSFNGVTHHRDGIQAEKACALLAVITGNVDIEGGYCLPRRFEIADIQPAPDGSQPGTGEMNFAFPFEVKRGERKVQVLFNHMSNPVYSSPAASVWREVLKNESLIPYLVDFSPFMSETADLADIILPDVVDVERHDIASSPTALLPWASMGMPEIEPVGQARDVRITLKSIVSALDPDGSRGMKKYWEFKDTADWVKQEVEATPELKEGYRKLKSKGVYPVYGKLDPTGRKIVKKGKPVPVEYRIYRKNGFQTPSGKIEVSDDSSAKQGLPPLPSWRENPRLATLKPEEFVLSTFKVAYHTLSRTTNLKYLAELWHSNPLWINKEVAYKLGIEDGALVRVTSEVGYLVTRAWLTNGIHPQVVGISTSVGRTAYGRVAQANEELHGPFALEELEDPDIEHNLWWQDSGTNPNDIIPIAVDPASGVQAWNDIVVTVTPAIPGDEYGQIQVDNGKHMAVYERRKEQG